MTRTVAPHPRALHARRPLIAVLEEVGRLRAVRRFRARPHHRDGEERREGGERSPRHGNVGYWVSRTDSLLELNFTFFSRVSFFFVNRR